MNDNPVQIAGALFEAVQQARIFPDSKTFPDCRARVDAKSINDAYVRMLRDFVAEHFELPAERPQELVDVYVGKQGEFQYATSSYPDFADLRSWNSVFAEMAAINLTMATHDDGRRTELLFGEQVSKETPREIFKLYFNVEDEGRTKSEIRTIIERRLELLDRKDQIRRGELI